jgi:hypothetical protein
VWLTGGAAVLRGAAGRRQGVRRTVEEVVVRDSQLWVWNAWVSLRVMERELPGRDEVLLSHCLDAGSTAPALLEAALSAAACRAARRRLLLLLVCATSHSRQ